MAGLAGRRKKKFRQLCDFCAAYHFHPEGRPCTHEEAFALWLLAGRVRQAAAYAVSLGLRGGMTGAMADAISPYEVQAGEIVRRAEAAAEDERVRRKYGW